MSIITYVSLNIVSRRIKRKVNFVVYLLSLPLSLPLPSSIITLGLLINNNLTNAVLSVFLLSRGIFILKTISKNVDQNVFILTD